MNNNQLKKQIKNAIFQCIWGTILCILPGCITISEKNHNPQPKNSSIVSSQTKLPSGLMYKNKPISDECMKELVPILCGAIESKEIDLDTFIEPKKQNYFDSDDCDEYEWKYIGTLPNGDHLVYGYLWPAGAMGKFTEIAVIRRTGNKLKAITLIAGGNRHATMINAQSCSLKENVLTYQQHMTNGFLYSIIIDHYPELSEYAKNKNSDELHWGEADYLGYGTFEATITPQGKIKNQHLASFTLAEGGSDNNSIQEIPKESLTMGKAMNRILDYYAYLHKQNTFTLAQLNEAMMEACAYAKKTHPRSI